MEDFNVTSRTEKDGLSVVTIDGPLDSRTFNKVAASLRAVLDAGCSRLLVDLSRCTYVSSSGAGVLIDALCRLEERRGALVLSGLRTEIRDTFAVLGLLQIFPIADSAIDGARILRTAPAGVPAA